MCKKLENCNKSLGWFTSLYYFMQHMNLLTKGHLVHKHIYAKVSGLGEYFNHESSDVRKKTAGELSRRVHSQRYVYEMQLQFQEDPNVFKSASSWLVGQLYLYTDLQGEEVVDYYYNSIFSDIVKGLANEVVDSGRVLDVQRVMYEIDVFLDYLKICSLTLQEKLLKMTEACLSVMAIGRVAAGLVDDLITPTQLLCSKNLNRTKSTVREDRLFVIATENEDKDYVTSIYSLVAGKSYLFGRDPQCDILNTNLCISKRHCLIFRKENDWYIRDCGSSNGTSVINSEHNVTYDSKDNDSAWCCKICAGDTVILAKNSFYKIYGTGSSSRSRIVVNNDNIAFVPMSL